jgi:cardiolipin synthase A/B
VKSRWIGGNDARLLENGEEFFPAVFDAIRAARYEVILETFILFEDKVGLELHAVLLEAAGRGVRIDMLVDGFGSCDLSPGFLDPLTEAGVRIRTFDPGSRWFGVRVNVLRRMHRKIVVVDGIRAFVGGINYSADHLADFGPQAKQDYAVELTGPVVDEIHRFAVADAAGLSRPAPPPRFDRRAAGTGAIDALFVTRDNHRHRNDIERHYRIAIRSARRRVLIANAYFFPGYRLLREMRRAARRGVDVRLILQGEPDMAIVKTAATLLYEHLQRDGVRIHEYCARPLHGKVAVVDDDWSTVGSSNLDPLSLSLNLEANVVLRGREFAQRLAERLGRLIEHECSEIAPSPVRGWGLWQRLRSAVVFHVLRRFPSWAEWLPRHAPALHVTTPLQGCAAARSNAGFDARQVPSTPGESGHAS